MLASIDRRALKVIHVHSNPTVIRLLVTLECGNVGHCDTGDTDSPFFLRGYTGFELRLLHKNLTGTDLDILTPDEQLRECLALVISRMPENDVNLAELEAQLELIPDDVLDTRRLFRYVRKSRRPAEVQELFHRTGLPVLAEKETLKNLALQRQKAASEYKPPESVPMPAQPARSTEGGVAAPQRMHTGKVAIWDFADAAWEKAGKPKDASVVLKLRKSMMDEMEEVLGAKRTTLSSELGQWMKARLSEA